MGATAGRSSSAERFFREQHCWTSQQWHPPTAYIPLAAGRGGRLAGSSTRCVQARTLRIFTTAVPSHGLMQNGARTQIGSRHH